MASSQAIAQQSDLLNRLVLDRETAEELGRVEQIWMVPELHRVMGIICKSGFLGSQKRMFTLLQIQAIGADSLVINAGQTSVNSAEIKPIESVLGREVWTDSGNRIGKITDFLFDTTTGEIVQYLFVASGWSGLTDGSYLLTPDAILSFGSKRVMIAHTEAEETTLHAEGVKHKVTRLKDFFKEDYQQTRNDFQSWLSGIQTITGQAKEQLQNFNESSQTESSVIPEPASLSPSNSVESDWTTASQVTELELPTSNPQPEPPKSVE